MSDGMHKLVYVSDVVSAIDDIVDTMSVCPSRDYCDGMRAMKRHIKQKIDELDSVNMVPIVRCGECESGIMDEILNEKYCNGEYHALDWFCADGKRKSDEEEAYNA